MKTNVGSDGCAFSPDGGVLALIEVEEGGARLPRLTIRSTRLGRQLQAMLLPRVGGRAVSVAGFGMFNPRAVAMRLRFHDDGRSLLLSTTEGLRQFEFPRSTLITTVVTEAEEITDFGFTHGGDAVYAFSEGNQEVIDLVTGDRQTTTQSGQFGLLSADGAKMSVIAWKRTRGALYSREVQPSRLRITDVGAGSIEHEFEIVCGLWSLVTRQRLRAGFCPRPSPFCDPGAGRLRTCR